MEVHVCVCFFFFKTGIILGFRVGGLALWESGRHGGSPGVYVFL